MKSTAELLQEFEALASAPLTALLSDSDDTAFLALLAKARTALAAYSEELAYCVFLAVEPVIGRALHAFDRELEETFRELRDSVYISLQNVINLFRALDRKREARWHVLYETLRDEFDAGEALYRLETRHGVTRSITFSKDPEQRLYEVAAWIERNLGMKLRAAPYRDSGPLGPAMLVLVGSRKMLDTKEKQARFAELARTLWRAAAAFVTVDTLQVR